jgi:hypothetical protein
VRYVQVEDHARIAFPRPAQETLLVLFDQPDRAVDDVRFLLTERQPRLFHEVHECGSRHVDFSDHLCCLHFGVHLAIQLDVIVGLVCRGELPVMVIDLSPRCQITAGVEIKRQPLVGVGVLDQPGPVLGMKSSRIFRKRRPGVHGLITGKDPAP